MGSGTSKPKAEDETAEQHGELVVAQLANLTSGFPEPFEGTLFFHVVSPTAFLVAFAVSSCRNLLKPVFLPLWLDAGSAREQPQASMKEKFTATMARTMKQNMSLVGLTHEPTPVESAAAALASDIPWPGERAKAVLSAIEARASRSHFNGLRCEALAKVPHEAISLHNALPGSRKHRQ